MGSGSSFFRTTHSTHASYRATWIATVAFFAGFYSLLEPFTRHLSTTGLSDGAIGFVLGSFGIAALIGRPFAGSITDRYGARPVMLSGAAALACGAVLVPFTDDFAALLGLRILQSLGYVAFTTAGTALIITLSPITQRAGRLAIYGAAANLAMSIAPALIGALPAHIPSATPFWLVAICALSGGLLIGRVPAAKTETLGHAALVLPALIRPTMIVTICMGAGFGAFFHFAPILAERRGPYSPGLLYSVYGLAIIATRLLAHGRINGSDIRRPLLLSAGLLGSGLALAAFAARLELLMLAAGLIAAGSGLSHPLLISYYTRLLPDAAGRAGALFYIGFDLGIGAGGWLLGAALQLGGLTALYLSGVTLMIGAGILIPQMHVPGEAG